MSDTKEKTAATRNLVKMARSILDAKGSQHLKFKTPAGESISLTKIADVNDDIHDTATDLDPFVSGLIITVFGSEFFLPRKETSVNSIVAETIQQSSQELSRLTTYLAHSQANSKL